MASDGIAFSIDLLIQDGQLEYVPVPWVLDYRRWRVYDRIPYQVKQRAGDRGITAENMELRRQHAT